MSNSPWWQTAVIYQVYPRSFQDTNKDGIGDLPGITARLDYLAAIGVDALWISPFYPSPMADFGYDVADYIGVDPLFGSLKDFDALIAAAHAKNLKVILDFVPNHTSDQHPWFLESKSSRDNPKRNWYFWRDAGPNIDRRTFGQTREWRPARSRLPNNWQSHFGGPAWTFDDNTQQWYLHSFLKEQPDLNWRNPEVREAIYGAMKFWLDRGVDGFRMDVLWLLIKHADFRNNPPNPDWREGAPDIGRFLPKFTADQPETHQIVREMRALMDTYGPTQETSGSSAQGPEHTPVSDSSVSSFAAGTGSASPASAAGEGNNRVLIGEIYLPLPELVRYYGASPLAADPTATPPLDEANLPFNFQLILTPWNAEAVAGVITQYESLLPKGAWPNYVLGNHDQSRLATRIGPQQARVAAMLLLTLRGTPTLYYGDELGMTDVPIAADQVQDPAEKNEPGKGKGRDPERSPMLWDATANAGFTSPAATPWLPLLADHKTVNVTAEGVDPRSMLSLYRVLLTLRRQHPALHSGDISEVRAHNGVLSYTRSIGYERFQIHLNLTHEVREVPTGAGTVVLTTIMDGAGSEVKDILTLEGAEGILVALM